MMIPWYVQVRTLQQDITQHCNYMQPDLNEMYNSRARSRIHHSDWHAIASIKSSLHDLCGETLPICEQMPHIHAVPRLHTEQAFLQQIHQRILDPLPTVPARVLHLHPPWVRQHPLDRVQVRRLNLPEEDAPEHGRCAHALDRAALELPAACPRAVRRVVPGMRLLQRACVFVLGSEEKCPVELQRKPGPGRLAVVVHCQVESELVCAAHRSSVRSRKRLESRSTLLAPAFSSQRRW